MIVKSGRRICGTGAALANAPLVQDKSFFEMKIPLFVHVFNCHKIPWPLDTTVQRSCYNDVDIMISLLFAMATCVSLFKRFITYGLQNLACVAESVCEVCV